MEQRSLMEQALEFIDQSGIYAIVHTDTGQRYVGEAKDIGRRLRDHFRKMRAGLPESGDALLFARYSVDGESAFHVEILELVSDNEFDTHYFLRPDNLALAEQYYIRERAELNMYRETVSHQWDELIRACAWRSPIDEATLARIASALPPYAYKVGKRVTWDDAVIVMAFSESTAKQRARERSPVIASYGKNLSSKRLLTERVVEQALAEGCTDLRWSSPE